MGELWKLIEEHMDGEYYRPSQRKVAQALGVSPTTVGNWRTPKNLPAREHLVAIARVTRVPYRVVLEAALADIGYVPRREGEERGDGSATIHRSQSGEGA